METSPLVSHGDDELSEEGGGQSEEVVGKETTLEALWGMVFGEWVSLLLVFAPFALASHFLEWSPQYTFWLCFLTMIPLASILGDFTEEAAAHTNEVIGGLVRTCFLSYRRAVSVFKSLFLEESKLVSQMLDVWRRGTLFVALVTWPYRR